MFFEKYIQTSCKFLMYERFSTKSLPDKYTPVEMYCNSKGKTKTVRNKTIEDIFLKFMDWKFIDDFKKKILKNEG